MFNILVNFFIAAIEAAGLKPVTDFLARFGGWPLTLENWDPSSFDWKVLINLEK